MLGCPELCQGYPGVILSTGVPKDTPAKIGPKVDWRFQLPTDWVAWVLPPTRLRGKIGPKRRVGEGQSSD